MRSLVKIWARSWSVLVNTASNKPRLYALHKRTVLSHRGTSRLPQHPTTQRARWQPATRLGCSHRLARCPPRAPPLTGRMYRARRALTARSCVTSEAPHSRSAVALISTHSRRVSVRVRLRLSPSPLALPSPAIALQLLPNGATGHVTAHRAPGAKLLPALPQSPSSLCAPHCTNLA